MKWIRVQSVFKERCTDALLYKYISIQLKQNQNLKFQEKIMKHKFRLSYVIRHAIVLTHNSKLTKDMSHVSNISVTHRNEGLFTVTIDTP